MIRDVHVNDVCGRSKKIDSGRRFVAVAVDFEIFSLLKPFRSMFTLKTISLTFSIAALYFNYANMQVVWRVLCLSCLIKL